MESEVPWESRRIMEDILFLLKAFEFWECKHTDRLENKCADKLEKYARKESYSNTWLCNPPIFLLNFIQHDSP